MSEERTQALVVPHQAIIYPPIAVNQHTEFGAGSGSVSGVRFATPDLQDCDYEIINYEELEKLLPDPKPLGRVELGLLPDGRAFAPKTASRDNFLLFPSKSSYILYFTHHYFSRENLNRDHTFLNMLIDKLLLPLDKLVKAPRLAAIKTTTEDAEHALNRSRIVCLEDFENGTRCVRRIDGYPASLLPEDGWIGSAHHSVTFADLMAAHGCFPKQLGPEFVRPIFDEDTQRFMTASDIRGSCVSIPTSINLPASNSIAGSTTMLSAATNNLVRVPGQPNQSSCVQSLSSCTNPTPSENQPNSNIVHSASLRQNTGSSWQYQPQSLFVVGPHYNRQSVSQTPTIGAMAENSALVYGLSHPHQASSLWGMRARYPYPPSQQYNSSMPIPVPGADSHHIASGLPVRPPAAGHVQQYLFGHPNPPSAYPNSVPMYPTVNPINLAMANAFAGQSANQQHRQQTQTSLPPQYAANPFFAGTSGQFASATAGAFNANPSNINFTNSYIGMALATMAAATHHQQQHPSAGSTGTSYFHPPIGVSPQNPFNGNAASSVPIVYAAQSQLPLHLARHHPRLPPPSHGSTVYALPTPYHLAQAQGSPTVLPSTTPAPDLCGPQSVSNSRASDATNNSSTPNFTNSNVVFTPTPASVSTSQTTTIAVGTISSPQQTQQHQQLASATSPGSSSFHLPGQISNFQSLTSSIPNLVASSLAAAAAGLSIQYPPARPSAGAAGTNPFGGASFNLTMSSGMIPTSCCGSPLQTGSSGVGSKSDTPNVDFKTDELDMPKPDAHQVIGYAQAAMTQSQSAVPLAKDVGIPSDEACVDIQQPPASDSQPGVGADVESRSPGRVEGATEELTSSPDDSADDSVSSGIGEMNSHCSNGGANAGETNASSHGVDQTTACQLQERKPPVNKNNYVFVSCKRRQQQQQQQQQQQKQHVIPVKESTFKP